MKRLIRAFVIASVALWLVENIAPGALTFEEGLATLALAGLALAIVNFFIRPLINLLLLPINLVTLGTLRWIANVITLYLVTLIVPGFSVSAFVFEGFSYQGFSIPSFSFGTIASFIIISLLISVFSSFFFWLSH